MEKYWDAMYCGVTVRSGAKITSDCLKFVYMRNQLWGTASAVPPPFRPSTLPSVGAVP